MVVFKVAKVQPGHTFEHGGQTAVSIRNSITEGNAGGIKIGKQAFNILLRRVALGGRFDGGKDAGQIGIQVVVGIRAFGNVGE